MGSKVPGMVSDNIWEDFRVSYNSVFAFLLSSGHMVVMRSMLSFTMGHLSKPGHIFGWNWLHLCILLKIAVPFSISLGNKMLIMSNSWMLILSKSSIHIWISLVLEIKIICIWLWYMIWIFSLSKGCMNCWDLIISVVPLAQV